MAVVCLFLVNDIMWAYPDGSQAARTNTLARWLLTKALQGEGVEDPCEVDFEAVTGIMELAKGMEPRTVNSLLTENAARRGTKSHIEFLSCERQEGGVTTAQFCLAKNKETVFIVSRGENGAIHYEPASRSTLSKKVDDEAVTPMDVERTHLIREIVYKKAEQFPLKIDTLVFLVTNQCDGDCRHCLFNSKLSNPGPSITFENIAGTLKFWNSWPENKSVRISGGEPFLEEPRVLYILQYMRTKWAGILTNGFWADDKVKTLQMLKTLDETVKKGGIEGELRLELACDPYHYHIETAKSMEEISESSWKRIRRHANIIGICLTEYQPKDMENSRLWVEISTSSHPNQDLATRSLLRVLEDEWDFKSEVDKDWITIHRGRFSHRFDISSPIRTERIGRGAVYLNEEEIPPEAHDVAIFKEDIGAYEGMPLKMLLCFPDGRTHVIWKSAPRDLYDSSRITSDLNVEDTEKRVKEIMNLLKKDPYIFAINHNIELARRIAEEVDGSLEARFQECNTFGEIAEALFEDPSMMLYVTKRLLQNMTHTEIETLEHRKFGKLPRVSHAELRRLGLNKSRKALQAEYFDNKRRYKVSGMEVSTNLNLYLLQEKQLSIENTSEKQLLAESARYLGDTPVNEHIDISAIPQDNDQLKQNMKTLARLIAWNNTFGLNIRYTLDNDSDESALEILRSELIEIGKIPGINSEELLLRLGTSHLGNNVINIYLATVKNIKKIGQLTDREYAVALKDGPKTPGIPIPNYTAASAIGIVLAALKISKEKEGKNIYDNLRKNMFDIISAIYKRFKIIKEDKEFMIDDLEYMVIGCSANKLKYAILYALPPIVKDLLERLQKSHEALRLMLQAA